MRGKPSSNELTGMTARERFFALGSLDRFDNAARSRDRKTMVAIYRDAEIEDAEWCVDTILANLQTYGF